MSNRTFMNDNNLKEIAINLALNCKWEEAIKINKQILKLDDTDIDAMNRLSRAYYESGDLKHAKQISKKVLGIEQSNNIAKRALEKYGNSNSKLPAKDNIVDVSDFLEEPGKTKQVNLLNVGASKAITCLDSGDELILSTHSHKVTLTTLEGVYVGKLPDDLSARLRNLVKSGNKYKVLVKSVSKSTVKIFIREILRGKEIKNVQSFPRETSESGNEFSSQP